MPVRSVLVDLINTMLSPLIQFGQRVFDDTPGAQVQSLPLWLAVLVLSLFTLLVLMLELRRCPPDQPDKQPDNESDASP